MSDVTALLAATVQQQSATIESMRETIAEYADAFDNSSAAMQAVAGAMGYTDVTGLYPHELIKQVKSMARDAAMPDGATARARGATLVEMAEGIIAYTEGLDSENPVRLTACKLHALIRGWLNGNG